ncbi:PDZ domain-containing protein [Thiohalocapsa sp. ML1]|jgi:membrane-associated protease RseP (regulator of RpoE activity)|uniref:PDZ domain-containing protein n=1 Tax=Thiohalocapsa sp. ML1 TaxID=1431688 RepID=UPI0009E8784F|nr:PDZ domain-containing protein [Thiohalocapsa sp. ML1]
MANGNGDSVGFYTSLILVGFLGGGLLGLSQTDSSEAALIYALSGAGLGFLAARILHLAAVLVLGVLALFIMVGVFLFRFNALAPGFLPDLFVDEFARDYQEYREQTGAKAFAVANGENRRVWGWSTGRADQKAANQAALGSCNALRQEYAVSSTCKIYATGNLLIPPDLRGRCTIGLSISDLDAYGYSGTTIHSGARVEKVYNNLPAAAAGLLPGDIIYEINDRKVTGTAFVSSYTNQNCGEALTILYLRHDSHTLQAYPVRKSGRCIIGVQISDVTNLLSRGELLNYGARIDAVEPNSPAERAGVKVGDVVHHIDGEKVWHTLFLSDYINTACREVSLSILRYSSHRAVSVEPIQGR